MEIIINEDRQGLKETIEEEYNIFLQSEYIEPNVQKRVLEYDKYPNKKFLRARTLKGDVVGVVRLLYDNQNRIGFQNFPTINDFKRKSISKNWQFVSDNERAFEVCTMGIDLNYRGSEVMLGFVGYIINEAATENYFGVFASLDERFYRTLNRLLPLEQIAEEKFYMGSVTVPVFFETQEVIKTKMGKKLYDSVKNSDIK